MTSCSHGRLDNFGIGTLTSRSTQVLSLDIANEDCCTSGGRLPSQFVDIPNGEIHRPCRLIAAKV